VSGKLSCDTVYNAPEKEPIVFIPGPASSDTPFESFLESEAPPARRSDDITEFVQQIRDVAAKLQNDGATRGDAKLLASALKELRHCFRVFGAYRGVRKVSVFGSARTKATHPAFTAAVDFGKLMADAGWMVITGAAAGIMEAGHVGAGRERSFGLNILLPFESGANPVISGDVKLMNMRYFFTRKLVFLKESDAVVLFPGGFGTLDELFESLTLIQTGKSHVFPIVLVDEPGGTYWKRCQQFINDDLLENGYIGTQDLHLYTVTDSVAEAVNVVQRFYRNYHSMRYVAGELVLRMHTAPTPARLAELEREFADIIVDGGLRTGPATPSEANEPAILELPRLIFRFNKHDHGRLRQLIDRLND
jgi:uncharacterized protein (TIGR00730 family)